MVVFVLYITLKFSLKFIMKKGIHPTYLQKAKIACACGNVIETGSTVESMQIEICSACHPFYTGKKKLVDSTGQVDRFKKRMEKASKLKKGTKDKKEKAQARAKAKQEKQLKKK